MLVLALQTGAIGEFSTCLQQQNKAIYLQTHTLA